MPGGSVRAVDLFDVEDRVSLQERDFPLGVVALLVRLGAAQAVRIDDGCALLALADTGVEFKRLLERHPGVGAVALVEGLSPQQQNVGALIGRAVVAQRQCDSAGRVASAPRLQPRADAVFEVGDYSVGNAGVEVGFGHDSFSIREEGCVCTRWLPEGTG